jgi:23S rRNA (uracil1939-C5)-methyltransferase
VLYRTVLAFARPGESDTAADIYCGAGAITLLMAQNLSSVLGIEENAQAVLDARANALANGIANASFYQGTAEYLLPRMAAEGYHPDIVTLDPPRKGLSPAVIDAVALAAPSRVVYVACDAATQARDAKLFAARGYRVTRSMCVDMFCWTGGIEHVILLEPA